ncbi:bacteriorhodopsin, partial [Sphingomonas bacterium]|uniref:bacteriorhodopsin n=1 Tax=Sphingomonas bacterium TaxID=1895847 RepID=UPI0015775044
MTLSNWLWFGFIAMALGSAILLVMGWNRRTRDEENHYLLHLFVTLAATASYLAMALGQGSLLLADGREFYVARYVDWSITTPMLLTGLCLTALHSPFRRWALLLGLVFTDFYMIATGTVAGFSPTGSSAKWAWYLISSGAFLFIYVGLWGPLRSEATKSGPRAAALYTTNASILSVVWFAYPVIFLLGSEGIKAIDATTTGALYTIVDVFAKVAYGIWSMAGTRRKITADLAAGEVPEHDLRPAPVAYHQVEEQGRTERV